MKQLFAFVIALSVMGGSMGYILPVVAQAPPPAPAYSGSAATTGVLPVDPKGILENVGRSIFGGSGQPKHEVPELAGEIIKIFLGLLGIIFLGLIIYGGYLWMTAMGDEEKIKKSQQTIVPAVVGVVIILAAYSLVHFVL